MIKVPGEAIIVLSVGGAESIFLAGSTNAEAVGNNLLGERASSVRSELVGVISRST